MAEQPENITLLYLHRLDEKADRVLDRLQELTGRVGVLEENYASVSRRIDRIETRLDRIERRIDLSETPAAPR